MNFRIQSPLFADEVVLLASSKRDLQCAVWPFAANCEAAMVLCWTVERSHGIGVELLFKYHRILYTSDSEV